MLHMWDGIGHWIGVQQCIILVFAELGDLDNKASALIEPNILLGALLWDAHKLCSFFKIKKPIFAPT